MPKLVLDAMGGDYGPRVILEGATQALPSLLHCTGELVLVGDEQVIKPLLDKRRYRALAEALEPKKAISSKSRRHPSSFKVSFIHASQTIDMEDSVRSIRTKPNATINVGCQLAAQDYSIKKTEGSTAFISAGHSGAIMTSALLHMGRLSGIERPAIAVKLPTLSQDGCILIDAGANIDCRPEHLRDFAIMGAIYAQVERKSPHLPRIAVLSNGEERMKGNELSRSAATLIENLSCFKSGPEAIGQFVGYTEGKEIFKGRVDVVVTDGFIGNVVLKSLEGLGSVVTSILKREAKTNPLNMLGFLLSAGVFARFKKRFDYAEYGAAPLLGVSGSVFICHGKSNPRAIKNALLRAYHALSGKYIECLEKVLEGTHPSLTEVT